MQGAVVSPEMWKFAEAEFFPLDEGGMCAVAGGVFSVLYYLRPLPDLFAALRPEGSVSGRPLVAPGVLVATLAVLVLSVFPGLAWYLARGA